MINKVLRPVLELLPENNRWERIWVLAKTDFLKRYYGSFLGVLWALINPLAQLGIYYFVFTRVFDNRQENFALFLFLGLVLYMFFTETSSLGLNLIKGKRHILENIQINWLDVYYAACLSTLFAFLFNFLTYFIISIFVGISVHTQALFVPLLIFNLLLFGFAMQVILSIVQIYVRDIVHVWDLFKMVLMWLSGVFYHIDFRPGSRSAILAYLTPLPGIIHNGREALIYGRPVDYFLLVYDMAYATVLLVAAMFLYKRLSHRALEKI